MVHVIDLQFFSQHTVAAFLVETAEGPVLVECGPYSTFPQLVKGINRLGYKASDIKHVLLTHIHLDHAGAAWAMAEMGATIHVHPRGFEHLANPAKLLSSAKRIYGDQMDTLWGTLNPIPARQLASVENGVKLKLGELSFIGWHTPGHAYHHIAWQFGKVVFTGDVGGVSIEGGPVQPPCPPPDIDVPAWKKSIELLRSLEPDRLYLTHFGARDNVRTHLDTLERTLDDWSDWVRQHLEPGREPGEIADAFITYTTNQMLGTGADDELIAKYAHANPAFMSVLGLGRYWKKLGEEHERLAQQPSSMLE